MGLQGPSLGPLGQMMDFRIPQLHIFPLPRLHLPPRILGFQFTFHSHRLLLGRSLAPSLQSLGRKLILCLHERPPSWLFQDLFLTHRLQGVLALGWEMEASFCFCLSAQKEPLGELTVPSSCPSVRPFEKDNKANRQNTLELSSEWQEQTSKHLQCISSACPTCSFSLLYNPVTSKDGPLAFEHLMGVLCSLARVSSRTVRKEEYDHLQLDPHLVHRSERSTVLFVHQFCFPGCRTWDVYICIPGPFIPALASSKGQGVALPGFWRREGNAVGR